MVSAEEFGRSLRGASGLVGRRADALALFGRDVGALRRSFAAIVLSLPAFVVAPALHRRALGLDVAGASLLADPGLAARLALGHVGSFLALPVLVLCTLPAKTVLARAVPWAVTTNWIAVCGSFVLALPGALSLMNLEPPAFTTLAVAAFTVVVGQAQYVATRLTLGIGRSLAASVVLLGLALDLALGGLVRGLAA